MKIRLFQVASLALVSGMMILGGLADNANAAITAQKHSSFFNTKNFEGDSVPGAAIWGSDISDWTTSGGNYVIVQDEVDGLVGELGNFSAANGWTAEIRISIDVPHTTGSDVFGMQVADDSTTAGHWQGLNFLDSGGQFRIWDQLNDAVVYTGDAGSASTFNTIRLAVEGTGGDNEIKMWVNDVLQTTPVGAGADLNRQIMGDDGARIKSGTASVDYFRWDTSGAFAPGPVPEPSTFVLLVVGLMGLAAARQRK